MFLRSDKCPLSLVGVEGGMWDGEEAVTSASRFPKASDQVMWMKILNMGASKHHSELNVKQGDKIKLNYFQKTKHSWLDKTGTYHRNHFWHCVLTHLVVSFNCVNVLYYVLNTSRENIISFSYQSNTCKVNFPISISAIMIVLANLLKSFNI